MFIIVNRCLWTEKYNNNDTDNTINKSTNYSISSFKFVQNINRQNFAKVGNTKNYI